MEMKPGYKRTEVGVIPEEWEVVTASEACSLVVDCKNRTPPIVDASEYAVVRTPNVRDGQFIQEDLRFTDESSYREWTARAVPKAGDIMITREAPLGEVCAVPETHKVCLGQRMMLYRPSPSKTDSRYLLYSLMSLPVRANLMRKIGGSTVGHAKVDDIRFLKLPLPPLSEQRTIATLLSDTDALLASLKQLISKKRAIKQAAMQELLTGKRRLPGFEAEWQVKRLGDIATIDPENLGSNTQPHYRFNYISLEDVDQGSLLSWSEQEFLSSPSRARRRLRFNDVLVSTVRPNLKSHLLFGQNNGEWVCSTGFATLRCNGDHADPGYVYFHLFGSFINKQIEALLTGSNYPAINSRDVRSLEIPAPTLPEQKEIARILNSMEEELVSLAQQLEKASLLKQGMMQQLLTGKIRLK